MMPGIAEQPPAADAHAVRARRVDVPVLRHCRKQRREVRARVNRKEPFHAAASCKAASG